CGPGSPSPSSCSAKKTPTSGLTGVARRTPTGRACDLPAAPCPRGCGSRCWWSAGAILPGMLPLVLALAVLLAPGTVDPRLDEPLRLLAELLTQDVSGRAFGPYYASLPETLQLTLTVAGLPPGAGGHSDPRRPTVP